jgi:hypothetical protein
MSPTVKGDDDDMNQEISIIRFMGRRECTVSNKKANPEDATSPLKATMDGNIEHTTTNSMIITGLRGKQKTI